MTTMARTQRRRPRAAAIVDPTIPVEEHDVQYHGGNALWRDAGKYPTLDLAVVEAVQNAIDADACNVWVGIDLNARRIVILDDGNGITTEKYREALLSIGHGIKSVTALGRFGLGMISPINKCDRYILTSLPRGASQVNQWVFVGADIRQQARVKVPYFNPPELPALPMRFMADASRHSSQWRTVIQLEGIAQDRALTNMTLDSLSRLIYTKLGIGMRRLDTRVHLAMYAKAKEEPQTRTINPLEFTGEPLPVVSYNTADTGEVRFELRRAPQDEKGNAYGVVLVMRDGDNSPVEVSDFHVQAMGAGWLTNERIKAAFRALRSGVFEGIIYLENAELHEDRKHFQISDAVRGAYSIVEQWYIEHGEAVFEETREVSRENRYQRLGEQALSMLTDLEGVEALAHTVFVLRGLLPGGEPPRPTARKERTQNENKDGQRLPRRRVVAKPPQPEGGTPARRNRIGLQFVYTTLANGVLWNFSLQEQTIEIDVRHPTWLALDEQHGRRIAQADQRLIAFQRQLIIELLVTLARHGAEVDFDIVREEINQRLMMYVNLNLPGSRP